MSIRMQNTVLMWIENYFLGVRISSGQFHLKLHGGEQNSGRGMLKKKRRKKEKKTKEGYVVDEIIVGTC